MSRNPPSITSWLESALSAVVQAPFGSEEFDEAFDSAFAPHATAVVNGKHAARDALKRVFSKPEVVHPRKLAFRDAVEAPVDGSAHERHTHERDAEDGVVGVSLIIHDTAKVGAVVTKISLVATVETTGADRDAFVRRIVAITLVNAEESK